MLGHAITVLGLGAAGSKVAHLVVHPERADCDAIELCRAAAHGELAAAKRILAGVANARPDGSADSLGRTPLFHAAFGGHVAVMQLLLEAGSHPDGVIDGQGDRRPRSPGALRGGDPGGMAGATPMPTPVHAATLGGFVESVKLLLVWGADITIGVSEPTLQDITRKSKSQLTLRMRALHLAHRSLCR